MDRGELIPPVKYDSLSPRQRRVVRDQYVRMQEGKCCWCREPLDGLPEICVMSRRINMRLFPPGFLRYPVHLQHNHATGMTEGAVHSRCNAVMW